MWAAGVWAKGGRSIQLRAYDSHRAPLGLLPDWVNLQYGTEYNAPGAISFDYLRSGRNWELLSTPILYIAPLIDGVEADDWYVVDEDSDDPADAAGRFRLIRVNGRGMLSILETARVYPKAHVPGGSVNGLNPEMSFHDDTPGSIMQILIQRAQARGALPDVELSFTATHDSAGVPWPKVYDITYTAGLDYLSVLSSMADSGWCDISMSQFTLNLYVADSVLGVDHPNVVVRRGANVLDSAMSRRQIRRGLASVVLGVGGDKRAAEYADGPALAEYGRREGYVGDGRVTTAATMAQVTAQALAEMKRPSETFTLELALDQPPSENWVIPERDFSVGHWIRYDQKKVGADSDELEPLRVRAIAFAWDNRTSGQPRTATIELADKWLEWSVKLKRRVEGVLNGSSKDAPPPPDPAIQAQLAIAVASNTPNAPDDLAVTSDSRTDDTGRRTYADATVTWTAPTHNLDGTSLDNISHYLIERSTDGTRWAGAVTRQTEGLVITDQQAGGQLWVRVATVTLTNRTSAWATVGPVTLAVDEVPPPAPSAPTVSARLGTVTVVWDGLNAGNVPKARDFYLLEIHASTGAGFTPTAATKVDQLSTAGLRVIGDLPYNTTYYFKFVALDFTGNASTPSAEASVQVVPLVDTDFINLVIDGANIKPGTIDAAEKIVGQSITGALIQALTIEAGHIKANAITADKIQAGAITADQIALGAVGADEMVYGPANLIPDGEFENPDRRTARSVGAPPAVSWVNSGATDAGWVLRFNAATNPSTTRPLYLIPGGIQAAPGGKFYMKARYRATPGSDGRVGLGCRWTLRDGTSSSGDFFTQIVLTADGAWRTIEGVATVPANAVLMEPRVSIPTTNTTGIIDFDSVDLRPVMASTGTSGRSLEISPMGIRAFGGSNVNGARVELDAGGVRAYDASGGQTVNIESGTGKGTFTGTLQTGIVGQRIVFDPAEPYATLYFFPTVGTNAAYMNAIDTDDTGGEAGKAAMFGINTGKFQLNPNADGSGGTRVYQRLYMAGSTGVDLGFIRDSTQASVAANLQLNSDLASLSFSNVSGADISSVTLDAAGFHYLGKFLNYTDEGANQGLMVGRVAVSGTVSSFTISYGATRSSDVVPIATVVDNVSTPRAFQIHQDPTRSAFTVECDGTSGAWKVNFIALRI